MADERDLTHLRLRIEGFVQAVGYRNYVISEATRLGVDGWVRNRTDGTVEALVSGHRAGSRPGDVQDVSARRHVLRFEV